MCETTSKLRKIKTQARRHGSRSGVFIIKSEQISHTVLVLKTLHISAETYISANNPKLAVHIL